MIGVQIPIAYGRPSGYSIVYSTAIRTNFELQQQTPKVLDVQNVLKILYHFAKFGGARISPAAGLILTKLQTKISWILSMTHAVHTYIHTYVFAIRALPTSVVA